MNKEMNIDYSDGQTSFRGQYFYDDRTTDKKPGVLVVPDYYGISDFSRDKAKKLVDLGYVGFAVDMYGEGKTAKDSQEGFALLQPVMNDRPLLLKRISAAFETIKKIDVVDVTRIAVMGFCFGGVCALDLARSGADFKGAVGFHARLNPPNLPKKIITAKILVLHGYDDPMAPPEDIIKFADEMNEAKANWEMDIYGGAMHSFTKPSANNPEGGQQYNKQAAERSWITMKNFFAEIF